MTDTNQLIEPQRYRPDWWQDFRSIVTAYMASDDDGAYVKYEDYAAQQKRIEELSEVLAEVGGAVLGLGRLLEEKDLIKCGERARAALAGKGGTG